MTSKELSKCFLIYIYVFFSSLFYNNITLNQYSWRGSQYIWKPKKGSIKKFSLIILFGKKCMNKCSSQFITHFKIPWNLPSQLNDWKYVYSLTLLRISSLEWELRPIHKNYQIKKEENTMILQRSSISASKDSNQIVQPIKSKAMKFLWYFRDSTIYCIIATDSFICR